MFIRFDKIQERDRRTDRQTDKQTDRQTLHSIAWQNVAYWIVPSSMTLIPFKVILDILSENRPKCSLLFRFLIERRSNIVGDFQWPFKGNYSTLNGFIVCISKIQRNLRSQLQWPDVIFLCERLFLLSYIRLGILLCDADRDLLAIATFLARRFINPSLFWSPQSKVTWQFSNSGWRIEMTSAWVGWLINQSINQTRQFLTRRNTAKPLQGRDRTRPPRPTLWESR